MQPLWVEWPSQAVDKAAYPIFLRLRLNGRPLLQSLQTQPHDGLYYFKFLVP